VSQNGGDTTITWTIKETKVKKKRKNTEDPGQSYDPG
jgi:hypothetical protein